LSRVHLLKAGISAAAAATIASLVLAAAPALARSITVSFAASPQSSAHFAQHHKAIKLHVAGTQSTAYAVVKLHNFPTTVPNHAPSFQATYFSSGTPRWYIKFANGDYMFGYPYDHAWDAHTTSGGYAYGTYKAMVAYLTAQSGGTLPKVKKVQIIADGSAQQFPYTTFLSEVRYAGQSLTK
jgi:hypothetical protein